MNRSQTMVVGRDGKLNDRKRYSKARTYGRTGEEQAASCGVTTRTGNPWLAVGNQKGGQGEIPCPLCRSGLVTKSGCKPVA